MKHSNREEIESQYSRELAEAREQKKLQAVQGNNYDDYEDDEPAGKKGFMKLPCCLVAIAVVVGSFYVIYFVYSQIKDPAAQEWLEKQELFEQLPDYMDKFKQDANEQEAAGIPVIETSDQEQSKIDLLKNKFNDLAEKIQSGD